MDPLTLLVLLMLFKSADSGPRGTAHEAQAEAARAQQKATAAHQRAQRTGHPADHAAAAQASQKAAQASANAAAATHAATAPKPWPQAVPAGLAPWPSGWTPDNPPPPGVVSRAFQLLSTLWASGAGSRKTEQTEGRWITYVATPMAGGKKGVVAWREKAPGASPPPTTPGVFTPASSPGVVPRAPAVVPPAVVPAAAAPSFLSTTPTLRQGSQGPDVAHLQSLLGVTADGKFGTATAAALRNYQSRHGLTPDAVAGPKTWAALLGHAA